MKGFRLLNADEIECRVAQVRESGITLLLYKDARCDMNILDETVGMMQWKKTYSRENRNCTVYIWDSDKKEWIGKEDTGTESYTEAEKGLASDSFKRACVNWGIGRELYTAPQIKIGKDDCRIINDGGKLKCFDRFDVLEIGYDEKERISELTIARVKSGKREVVFKYSNPYLPADMVRTLAALAKDHGHSEAAICQYFGVNKYEELTVEQFTRLMDSMSSSKEGEA